MDKKKMQLGMNPSTASGRLVKDLLWNYIVKCGDNKCHKCGEEMSRETFSIEHVVPWLDSENPTELFFDIGNISYSHLVCNISSARKTNKVYETGEEKLEAKRRNDRNFYNNLDASERKRRRNEKYRRTGN
ncbi:hypothetical protein APT65_00055 [Trabzonvirus APT65]|uniref:HNH endonuclease n=1 Tax=Aeromonas phage APT65 TaxID=2982914 RepID=A0A9E8K4K8_9CAUD|nr:hypothetical protein APT65_00055 [Aeromonas phage APT65]